MNLRNSVKLNKIKEEKTENGLKSITINVTSWSPKIKTYMIKLAKEYDIVLIQEHHKLRAKDLATGPCIVAGFAPAQRIILKPNGKDLHTSGGVAIFVRHHLYFEKDKYVPQSGRTWAAVKMR